MEAILPTYAYDDYAGFDLFSVENVEIKPNERKQILTGLSMQIPKGFVGLIWGKSGLSHKYGLKVLGGVIDSGYRGEVAVGIINLGNESYTIDCGNKIAQMLIQKKEKCEIVEVASLEDSNQSAAGFGSSGK